MSILLKEINQPTVSHHLRLLREAGSMRAKHRGAWVYHRLADDASRRLEQERAVALPVGAAV